MKRILLTLLLLFICSTASAVEFKFIHISDPHLRDGDATDTRLQDMVDWIVTNEVALGISLVVVSGDFVPWPIDGDATILEKASGIIADLATASIPYLITMGNHDYDKDNTTETGLTATKDATTWIAKFPDNATNLTSYTYQGEVSGPVAEQNIAGTFVAGGETWLVVGIDQCPIQATLDWADSVMDNGTGIVHDRIIFVTHDYMSAGDGVISNTRSVAGGPSYSCQDTSLTKSGEQIYQTLIVDYPETLFVLSGHVWDSSDPNNVGGSRITDVVNGMAINQMRANWQAYKVVAEYNIYMRIITIDTASDTMQVDSYAESTNHYIVNDDREDFPLSKTGIIYSDVHGVTLKGVTLKGVVTAQ